MSHFARIGLVAALLPIAACSSMGMGGRAANSPPPIPAAPPTPTLAAADMNFVTQAANDGEAEVQLGQLASTKAARIGIRKFANQMVTDHTLVNQQLATLATQKGVTVTPMLDPAHADMLKQLQGESGPRFDKAYIHGQVADHMTAVQLFQQEATNGSDPDLKALAQTTLPKLKQHLAMAEREDRAASRRMTRAQARIKG